MLPEDLAEPYIDDDQIIEVESYMDDLVAHMLAETQNGQEPVVFYRTKMVDAIASVADLMDLIPQLTGKDSKAEAKRMTKILLSMCDLLDFTLLMAHAFETGIPDAEIIAAEVATAIFDVQTNATICAMSLLDTVSSLGYDFFIERNAAEPDKETVSEIVSSEILNMLAGICKLCEHLGVDLFDVMYSRS
jgi:hypothetical protein